MIRSILILQAFRGRLRRLLSKAPSCPPRFRALDFVDSDYPPTCILAATKDAIIPPPQWDAFILKLKELGVPHRIIYAEGMVHGQAENGIEEVKYNEYFRDCIRPGVQWMMGER